MKKCSILHCVWTQPVYMDVPLRRDAPCVPRPWGRQPLPLSVCSLDVDSDSVRGVMDSHSHGEAPGDGGRFPGWGTREQPRRVRVCACVRVHASLCGVCVRLTIKEAATLVCACVRVCVCAYVLCAWWVFDRSSGRQQHQMHKSSKRSIQEKFTTEKVLTSGVVEL